MIEIVKRQRVPSNYMELWRVKIGSSFMHNGHEFIRLNPIGTEINVMRLTKSGQPSLLRMDEMTLVNVIPGSVTIKFTTEDT